MCIFATAWSLVLERVFFSVIGRWKTTTVMWRREKRGKERKERRERRERREGEKEKKRICRLGIDDGGIIWHLNLLQKTECRSDEIQNTVEIHTIVDVLSQTCLKVLAGRSHIKDSSFGGTACRVCRSLDARREVVQPIESFLHGSSDGPGLVYGVDKDASSLHSSMRKGAIVMTTKGWSGVFGRSGRRRE